LSDYNPATDAQPPDKLPALDRWALSRFERYSAEVLSSYEKFEFHRVYHATVDLCAIDLSAVYFDALKDRTYCSGKSWPARRAAQTVLHRIADQLCRLLAPMASFTAEEAWQQLPPVSPEGMPRAASVFLAGFPKPQTALVDLQLEKEFETLKKLRDVVNGALEQKRAAKELGKATEADVVVTLSHELAAGFEGQVAKKHLASGTLADLLLCGTVTLAEGGAGPTGIAAVVNKSPHAPCERCFRALAEVKKREQLAGGYTLCNRCLQAVAELDNSAEADGK
jgi:isoleucyl-tRNA synthetase